MERQDYPNMECVTLKGSLLPVSVVKTCNNNNNNNNYNANSAATTNNIKLSSYINFHLHIFYFSVVIFLFC